MRVMLSVLRMSVPMGASMKALMNWGWFSGKNNVFGGKIPSNTNAKINRPNVPNRNVRG
jgi:hypothetical protein